MIESMLTKGIANFRCGLESSCDCNAADHEDPADGWQVDLPRNVLAGLDDLNSWETIQGHTLADNAEGCCTSATGLQTEWRTILLSPRVLIK